MLLAIDTASRSLSLALYDGQQLLAEQTWYTANQHSVELPPAIHHVLNRAGVQPRQLTALAVAQGPGSFTGLRIGIGVAKGLAMAQNIPLIPVMTLDIVAAGTSYFEGPLVAIVQAGRGRINYGQYHWQTGEWRQVGELHNAAWAEMIARLDAPATLINGELDPAGEALLIASGKAVTLLPPAYRLRRAGFLAQKAWGQVQAGHSIPAAEVMPIYLQTAGGAAT
ncbi:MAG: tRNA (adenosine(37)-N6)-threonylcarbamoyltransferase complex dimerization subunit type 1 TsaB [Chloroflexi bacterium]|nr:tRNA (adenosine(37)-N6)-threonylcarbamoyltransferase complex dimerization subunit type 1 TsaB [Chloroflexota bacterium]